MGRGPGGVSAGGSGGGGAGLPGSPNGPTTPGTAYLPPARGPSSKAKLAIEWRHPSYTAEVQAGSGGTVALPQRKALSVTEAMAAITAGDRRPVLVLRECLKCSGTEDALMSSKEDNERTYLYARWFHCIKLSPDVLEADHPFHALFADEKPSHLFIANPDGSARHDLLGEHSRRELWGTMEAAIEANYVDSPSAAFSKLGRALDDLDEIDRALSGLETRYELMLGEGKSDTPAAKKLQKEIEEHRARRAETLKQIEAAQRLELKAPAAGTAEK
ncbi:MAG: hypothetical protein EXS08_13160 [Planctomycetes bacterium]|nr:hypothetical protein [Planctomycetota bacterium]